ncbi:metal-dependent hydrolase [Halobellus marinus]|jgi:inner membrane protein|uniref:metal-dependent hydrolase n=1 Tax=Halobellus TaxID=1073986 RepID=UPI0028A733F5|nr:metal-dependent hydrolase [Halobellus sp. DFY28]
MYRKGHFGVSLLVFSPIAFVLVAVEQIGLALVVGGVMVWLSMLPDLDHRVPGIPHRGPTHSLLFAALVGAVFAGLGIALKSAGMGSESFAVGIAGGLSLAVLGFAVGSISVVAHLLGDALTPAGVNFLWPLSSRTYTLSLWRANNTLANYGLFAVGIFATGAATYLGFAL